MPDHDDLIERLERLRDARNTTGPDDYRAALTEAINRLSGERITLYLCPNCEWNRSQGDWNIDDPLTCPACDEPLEVRVAALLPEGEGENPMTPNPIQNGEEQGVGDQGICPWCGSDDEPLPLLVAATDPPTYAPCPDSWHNPDRTPPETPGQREQWSEGWPKKVTIYSDDRAKEHQDRWVVPLSDTNHLRERIGRDFDCCKSAEQMASQLARVREWAEGGWAENRAAPLQVPTGSIDDHLERGRWVGLGDAAREVLRLLNTEESK